MIKIITIANSDSDLRAIGTLLLDTFPYAHIITAHSGKDGNEKARAETPNLIVINLKVPDEDGFNSWKFVKTDSLLSQVPLIIITPSAVVAKSQAKFMNIKAEAYISAPFDDYELKTQVTALLKLNNPEDVAHTEKKKLEELVSVRTKEIEIELDAHKATEKKLLLSNKELEDSRLASLNLLEDLKTEIGERNQAEDLMHQSEEHLRTLINSMTDLVCFKDGFGRWLVANEYDLNLFGLTNTDYVGKKDSELAAHSPFYHDVFLNCEASDEKAWQRGIPTLSDETIPLPDGTSLIFEVVKIPSFDPEGNRKGLVVVGRDITERKQAESQLRKLSHIVEQSPSSIMLTNIDGIIEYVNPALCTHSGYSSDELLGKNPRFLRAGSYTQEESKLFMEAILSGKKWDGEFHSRKKTGEFYWERASISPIKNHEGKITHFLSIKEDVTTQKHSENIQKVLFNISKQAFIANNIDQLLEFIKNELNILVDTSNFLVAFYNEEDGMLTSAFRTDENDVYTTWPAEKSLTGYVVRHNTPLMITSDGFRKLAETGEVELVGAPAQVWLGVPLTVSGKPYGAIVIQDYKNPDAFDQSDFKMLEFIASQLSLTIQRQKDYAELKVALAKAEAGDKLKSAFINNISHEIRTPLNGIIGFSEMILNPDSSYEDNELCYGVIRKSSKRLINTVNSYVDVALIVTGTMEISKRPTNIDHLLSEIYTEFADACKQKNVELTISKPIDQDVLILKSDSDKIRKVAYHLLDNAVKFIETGTITFGYEHIANDIVFFVKDTGPGIMPENIGKIYDAFMSHEPDTTHRHDGSGLGLTIAFGMVQLLGGKIWVESKGGSGAIFYFSLPVSENPIIPARIVTEAQKVESGLPPLVLIAEDDDSNFKYTEIVLQYASYKVMRAENGVEAVECCRNHPEIRVVLMDIKMPMMDGFEATKQIRKFRPDLPIIALTAHVTTEDENKAFTAGCTDYITKPVSKAKLIEIIKTSVN
ncbi:MAG: response regulator [Bacteroidales bacterium]